MDGLEDFWIGFEKSVRLGGVRGVAFADPRRLGLMGAPGYPPLTMFKDRAFCSNGTRSLIPPARRRCAPGCRFAAFAACRWTWRRPTMPRSGGFLPDAIDKLGLSTKPLKGEGQLGSTRCAGLRHQAQHAGRRDHPRRLCREASLRGRRRQSARPRGLASRASATRPISATRRIWRWTEGERACAPGRDDPGQCALTVVFRRSA